MAELARVYIPGIPGAVNPDTLEASEAAVAAAALAETKAGEAAADAANVAADAATVDANATQVAVDAAQTDADATAVELSRQEVAANTVLAEQAAQDATGAVTAGIDDLTAQMILDNNPALGAAMIGFGETLSDYNVGTVGEALWKQVQRGYPVRTLDELQAALANPLIYCIDIIDQIVSAVPITLNITDKVVRSVVGYLKPVFKASAGGFTLIRLKAIRSIFPGPWVIEGFEQDIPTGDGLELLDASENFVFEYFSASYFDRGCFANPMTTKVYAGHFDFVDFDYLTSAGFDFRGGTTAAFISYMTVFRIRAISTDYALQPIWFKMGDNVGSGGSPGLTNYWGEFYRGRSVLRCYSDTAPLLGTNLDAPRKITLYNSSGRALTGDAYDLQDGDEIFLYRPTADNADRGVYVGPDFCGQYVLEDAVLKDAWREGLRHDSAIAGRCVVRNPRVSGNSVLFGPIYNVVPKVGNVGNGTVIDVTGDDGHVPLVGAWKVNMLTPTTFNVIRPGGINRGTGTVGVRFRSTDIALMVTAGVTAYVAGDDFTINVTSNPNLNSGLYDGIWIHPSDRNVTIDGGLSGRDQTWRIPEGWIGLALDSGSTYFNATDGLGFTLNGFHIVPRTVVTDATSEFLIGADAEATIYNLWRFLITSENPNLFCMNYAIAPADATARKIIISSGQWFPNYNGWAIAKDADAALVISGSTLTDGNGTRSQRYGLYCGRNTMILGVIRLSANLTGGRNLDI